jgi:hypothetical protein
MKAVKVEEVVCSQHFEILGSLKSISSSMKWLKWIASILIPLFAWVGLQAREVDRECLTQKIKLEQLTVKVAQAFEKGKRDVQP